MYIVAAGHIQLCEQLDTALLHWSDNAPNTSYFQKKKCYLLLFIFWHVER